MKRLLDFPMNRDTLHDGIEFLEFEAVRGVFPILLGDVTAGAGKSARFVLGTFQDNLESVAFCFLSHEIG